MNSWGDKKKFVDIFGHHQKTGLFLGDISMHLRSRHRMGIF